jgi:TPR repeat protein
MTDIFLSYSSKDREQVRPLRDALAAMGYDVFWDVETPAGENWDQWIRKHIAKSKAVIVFWTKNSAASVNVQHECAIARDDNKLIPTQLEVMKAIDFPMGFYTTQAAAVYDWDGKANHAGYAQLIRAVRQRFEGNSDQIAEVVRNEVETEIRALTPRAESDDPVAQAELGFRHEKGVGVPKNEREAVRLYELAAKQGNARAQSNLGALYSRGRGGLPRSDVKAVELFAKAAAQGNATAQYNLGLMYENGRGNLRLNNGEAERFYYLAAQQNEPNAQCALARMYEMGRGTIVKNDVEALRLYRLAAEQGNATGQVALAALLEIGKGGMKRDKEQIVALYRAAAAQGDVEAFAALMRLGEKL